MRRVGLDVHPEPEPSASRRLFRRASLAALAAVALACGDATSPLGNDVRFVVETQPGSTLSSATGSTASAAGGPGVVVVIGRIVIPAPCFTLAPRVVRNGPSLDLAVVATPSAAACNAPPTVNQYTLRVASLPPATYRVRVLHEIQGSASLTELVLEQDVRVE